MHLLPTRTGAGRIRLVFAQACLLLAISAPAFADTFQAAPSRTIGPFVIGQTNPEPVGGWQATNDRQIGPGVVGQGGWSGVCSPERFDEELSAADSRDGRQSWRLSNWFHNGCVNHILSPAFAAVGEAGATTLPGGGVAAASNSATYEFWFRSASETAQPGAFVSTTITDAPGRRMTYLGLVDEIPGVGTDADCSVTGCFHVFASEVTSGDADDDDVAGEGDVTFVSHVSPDLQRDRWYRARVSATFNNGPLNDQIVYQIWSDAGVLVWDSGPLNSWEDAYLEGQYGAAPGEKVAGPHVAFRVSANPDTGNQSAGDTYSAVNRPQGFRIDDLAVTPAAGPGYATSFEFERHVAPTGNNAPANDCSVQANPCLTIQYAVDRAAPNNIIRIAPGTYSDPVTISGPGKAGIVLRGEGAPLPLLARLGGATNQRLLTINGTQRVRVQDLRFAVDRTFVAEAILANGNVDGLEIVGNRFSQSQSVAGTASTFGFNNTISINKEPTQNSAGLARFDGSSVVIRNNLIESASATTPSRSGIAMDAGVGLIEGNDITAGTHDMTLRFMSGGPSGNALVVHDNDLRGRGLEISSPNATAAGGIVVSNNRIQAPAAALSFPDHADFSLVRLGFNAHAAAVPTTFSGNEFSGYGNFYRGVTVQNWPALLLDGNTFTPAGAATDFASLVVSNKLIASGAPAAPLPMTVTATSNVFNGADAAGVGRAVEFLNDNDAGGSATFGALSFGADGAENQFDIRHRWYFRLDDHICQTHANTPQPQCTFLGYTNAVASVASSTDVRPFRGNVTAVQNRFGGDEPSEMTAAERNALFAQTQDQSANPALGAVNYGLSSGQAEVYVDASYSSASYGDARSFTHTRVNPGTVYVGVNAFASIPAALAEVSAGGSVYVAAGSYPGFAIATHASIIGNDSDRDGVADANGNTLITGQVLVSVSGASAAAPLALRNLEVSNGGGGFGVQIAGALQFIELEDLRVHGNVQHGLYVASGADVAFLRILSSTFDRNGYTTFDTEESLNVGAGFATSQTAIAVRGVFIQDSDFVDNAYGGLVINGGNDGGISQIEGWVIDGGQFSRNNRDATPAATSTSINTPFGAGGGLWLKTSGSGSTIRDFYVHGAKFADNGSARLITTVAQPAGRALNRVGVHVRVRAGATVEGVRLCDNTYEETGSNGIQEVGVYVFDQTGGSNYEPIEICGNNTFTGLQASVSGFEQFAQTVSSLPAVTIADEPLLDWEYLQFPASATVYVDDDFAGSINGASVIFPAHAAATTCSAGSKTFGIDAFSTIADALSAVAPGGAVCVAAGTYVEGDPLGSSNLVINKAVSLYGARAGILPTLPADEADASLVYPAYRNGTLSYSGQAAVAMVSVESDDVLIDGFIFDGDNPGLTSALGAGSYPDVDSGVFASGSRIVFINNQVRNLVYGGFVGFNSDINSEPAREGNRISRNWFHDIDAPSLTGVGILVLWNYYAQINDNLMQNVRIGIQTNYDTRPVVSPETNAVIRANEIHASRLGIYHNYRDADSGLGDPSPYTIELNRVFANDNSSESGVWSGIIVQAIYDGSAIVRDNEIDASALASTTRLRTGYLGSNLVSGQAITIDGGTVSAVDYGVLATDGAFYPGAVDNLAVLGVTFSDIAVAAVYVEDTDLAGSEVTNNAVSISLGENVFGDDVLHHGALSGPLASIDFDAGVSGLNRMLVKAPGQAHRGALADSNGNVRLVSAGVIEDAMMDVEVGGTVTLAAGTFAQQVQIGKSLSLVGPFAGIHGADADRDDLLEEAVIAPTTGVALEPTAADIIVDGITIDGAAGSHAIEPTAGADALQILNSRIVSVTNGSGLSSEPGADCSADGLLISRNLFSGITGASNSPLNGRGVRLGNGHCNVDIVDNDFDTVRYAVNANGGSTDSVQDLDITDNRVTNSLSSAFVITATTRVELSRNRVTASAGGIFISDRMTDFTARCNVLTTTGSGISTAPFFGGISNTGVRIFHNAISGGTADVRNALAQGLMVGSNWYDGAAASTANTGGPLLVADPLLADPITDVRGCGDNDPTQLVAFYPVPPSGVAQSADLNQPFAQPLRVRLQDELGGAVVGEDITITAPASGASALLSPTSGSTQSSDFNGTAQASAIANGFAGNYDAIASSSVGNVAFDLTNVALAQVYFDLNGPVAGVEVGDAITYTGTIANQNPNVTEEVRIRITVAGTTDPADVNMCVQAGMTCAQIQWTVAGGGLVAEFPRDVAGSPIDSFSIQSPYAPFTHVFRTIYGKAGLFTASAEVVGDTSGTVYASDVIATNVIAQAAGVALDLSGPIAGVERGVVTAYSARLSNSEATLRDNVAVDFVITRNGGIAAADILVEYDAGGGSFQPLPLSLVAGQLIGRFGPATGFPVGAGYDATTALRVTYNQAPDTFHVSATVNDAAATPNLDGVAVYAGDTLSTAVIEPDGDVSLDLTGMFAPADGTTLVATRVAQAVLMRAELANAGGAVPDMVQASFTLGADFSGIQASDVVASYWYVADLAASCAPVPAAGDRETVTFAVVGDTLTATTAPQPLPAGFEVAVCFQLEFARAGVYSIGAVIGDATGAADPDAQATYAADNLSLTVADSDATITLSGLGPFVFDGTARAATVSVTPSLATTVTYTLDNGVPTTTPPVQAGTYAVTASIDAGQGYAGSASGTLTITPKPVTIFLSGTGDYIYDGSAQSATASVTGLVAGYPLAAPLQIRYNGLAAAPTDAGSYAVTALFASGSERNYVALPAAGTIAILKRTIPVTIDGTDLQQSFGATRAVDATASPPAAPASQTVQLVEVTYNGSLTPPTAMGTYSVLAQVFDANYEGTASATLVIGDGAQVALSLDPVDAMRLIGTTTPGYTEFVDLDGALANTGTVTSQPVHFRISVVRTDDANGVGGNPVGIALDDVKACVFDPSGYAAQAPNHDGCPVDYQFLFKSAGSLNGRPSVVLRYPNLPANDQPLPTLPSTALAAANLRFRTGEYRIQIDVVGSTSGTVYASATTNTTTVPNADIAYSGATSGDAEDLLLSSTRLRNTGGRVDGNVIVRVTLSDAAATELAPITLAETDADFLYQVGADYATLPWAPTPAADGGLVTYFGPPGSGFPLEDGYDATTAGAGVFHRLGNYRLRYEVLDVATLGTVFAQSETAFQINPNAVNFSLSDLGQVYDGTPRLVTVTPSDVTFSVSYEALAGATCPMAATGTPVTPVDAGSYCVYVQATGNYSGSAAGTLVVSPALADVSIDGAVAGLVQRDFDGLPQVVTATSLPTVDGFVVTYDGAPTAPSAAGSYSVLATVDDPNYTGSASATLVISTAGGATIVLDDDDGTVDGTIHRSYSGSGQVITATTTPSIDYRVTYVGSGGTSYPLTETAPVDVGQYAVVATTTDANYDAVAASGTLVIEPATATITIDPLSLSATYDGQPHAVDVSTSPAGLALTVTYNGGGEPVDAGSYAVVANITDDNYTGSATATLVVEPAAAGLTAADVQVIYDGQPQGVSVNNPNDVEFSVSYAGTAAGGATYGPSATAPTAAGSYVATITVTDSNYTQAALLADVQIDPAGLAVAFGNLAHVYDGSAKFASVSTTPAGVSGVTLAYSLAGNPVAAPTDAGSYLVTATSANPNYVLAGADSASLVIAKATAQVTLSDLTRVFDGSPKPVVVTTSPAALTTTISYDGNAAAPSAVGSYTVVATVDATNYQGSASGTLTILAAAVSQFVADSSTTLTGTAGAALATASLPTVRVLDSGGGGVQGISVLFELGSDSGSATATSAITDATGRATVGSWILDRNAGADTMTARVNGLAGLPTLTFTATGNEVADIALDKTSESSVVIRGSSVSYTITVSNAAGPSNAADVAIVDLLPDGLDVGGATWLCAGSTNGLGDEAGCASAQGSGDIDTTASIPVGTSITLTLSATILADTLEEEVINEALATLDSGVDPEAGNNGDDHAITVLQAAPVDDIFEDGFEGNVVPRAAAANLKRLHSDGITLQPLLSDTTAPQRLLEAVDAGGKVVATVDGLTVGTRSWFRVRQFDGRGSEHAGEWQPLAGDVLQLSWSLSTDGALFEVTVPGKQARAGFVVLPGQALPQRLRTFSARAY